MTNGMVDRNSNIEETKQISVKNKQRHLNQKCSVLWLRIDAKTRMRKDFKLYKESDVFQLQTRKAKEVLGKELVDHGRDDDVETDEEIVKT